MATIALLMGFAEAQTDMYKCEAADGTTSFQDHECVAGSSAKMLARPTYADPKKLTLHGNANHQFFSTVTINGVSARGMIDTGASELILTPALAKAMSIQLTGRANALARTASGVTKIEMARTSVVKLGDIEVYNVDVAVSANAPTLIGMSVLKYFKISDENGNMVLTKR